MPAIWPFEIGAMAKRRLRRVSPATASGHGSSFSQACVRPDQVLVRNVVHRHAVRGEQLFEVLALQDVEPDPGPPAGSHGFQRRLVQRAPGVGKGEGIELDVVALEEGRGRARDARAPVDDRAEHVETEKTDLLEFAAHKRQPGSQPCAPAASAVIVRARPCTTRAVLS
jgi:hypothetical protein